MRRCLVIYYLLAYCLISFSQTEQLKHVYVALQYKDTLKAISILEKCGDIKCYKMLNEIYIRQYNFTKAKKICNKLFENKDTSYALELSKIYSIENNKDSAFYWLSVYLKMKSQKLPENILRNISEFNNLKNTNEWEFLWKKDWFNEYEKNIGEIYYLYSKKEYVAIIELTNKLLEKYNKDENLIYWKAIALYESGNATDALNNISVLLKNKTNNTKIFELALNIHLSKKDYKSAINILKTLIMVEPWNLNHLENIIKYCAESENYNEIIKYSEEYIKYDTLNYNVFHNTGYAYYLKGNYEKAIDYYTRAIKINSSLHESYFERGRCYYELKNYEKAYFNFSMAIDIKPFVGKYFFYRGLTSIQLNRKTSACSDFKKANQYGFVQADLYIKRYCLESK